MEGSGEEPNKTLKGNGFGRAARRVERGEGGAIVLDESLRRVPSASLRFESPRELCVTKLFTNPALRVGKRFARGIQSHRI